LGDRRPRRSWPDRASRPLAVRQPTSLSARRTLVRALRTSCSLLRSFISIPAGALGSPPATYTALTLAGSLIWCLGFAGAGWALGDSWNNFHHDFRYADYAAVAVAAILITAAIWHRQRARDAAPGIQPDEGPG
jgi:hypothetical protein